jgi:hypothetical protein
MWKETLSSSGLSFIILFFIYRYREIMWKQVFPLTLLSWTMVMIRRLVNY